MNCIAWCSAFINRKRINLSNEITIAPVVVIGQGSTATERKMSILQSASSAVIQAHVNDKGAVGKACREVFANGGLVSIARHASNANYKPLADHIALVTGVCVISNRASYESLTDTIEAEILKAKSKKNGGYREDKSGALVPTAALAALMKLKAEIIEVQGEARAMRVQRELDNAKCAAIELAAEQASK